tara:strand:+ start:205 stop:450 length:246 start_codon:yes stop_codon:yes gene_type:complete
VKKKMSTRAMKAALAGVGINLILPALVEPFATEDEVSPPDGAAALPIKGQLVHMLVHHNQVPFTSSVIVGAIVYLSVVLTE